MGSEGSSPGTYRVLLYNVAPTDNTTSTTINSVSNSSPQPNTSTGSYEIHNIPHKPSSTHDYANKVFGPTFTIF